MKDYKPANGTLFIFLQQLASAKLYFAKNKKNLSTEDFEMKVGKEKRSSRFIT